MRKTTVRKILTLLLFSYFNNPIWGQLFNNVNDTIQLPVPVMIQWDRSAAPSEIDSIMRQYDAKLSDAIREEKFRSILIDKYEIYKVPSTISTYLDLINYFDCDPITGVNGTGTSLGGRAKSMDLDNTFGLSDINQDCSYAYDIQNYHPYPHCVGLAYPDSNFYEENCISFCNKIRVIIIDAGVNAEDPLLSDLYNNSGNYNFINKTTDVRDTGTQHGSHVARVIIGTIGQTTANIELCAYKILNEQGIGTIFNLNAALLKSLNNGADIVNLSLGAIIPEADGCTSIMENILTLAATENTLVIAAAGNDTTNLDTTYYLPASLNSANLMVVGASDCEDRIAPFSNHSYEKVDLLAPGIDIIVGDNVCKSGTSFSTPIVSSLCAIRAATLPVFNSIELKNMVLGAVNKKPEWYQYCRTGGMINPSKLFTNDCWNNCSSEPLLKNDKK